MHVAYAETYQVTTREPDKAVKELDMAAAYMKKAEQDHLADKKSREKMGEVEKALQTLKANPNSSDLVVQESYDSIIIALSTLIQEL